MISNCLIDTTSITSPLQLNFASFIRDKTKQYKLRIKGLINVTDTSYSKGLVLYSRNIVQPNSYESKNSGRNLCLGLGKFQTTGVYYIDNFECIINIPQEDSLEFVLTDVAGTVIDSGDFLNMKLVLSFDENLN